MSQAIIQIDQLSKRYKEASEYSLKDVSFTINAGDKFGVFGPNGAGKTTLISIICKLFSQTSGEVRYFPANGHDLSIGFVPQDLALYEELTAQQNMEYFGALYKLSKAEVINRTEELLAILGLSKVAQKKVKTFSGGMKRRLNLAIGIIHNPEILFLDEPTVGVDIQSKNAIMAFLEELNETGTTIVYTSHHMEEAEDFCDTIAIMDYGKVIANDTLKNLYESYNVSGLMEIMILLTGKEYRDGV
ncbi:ABC transporter ATP-binding protein [Carboxylicivirga sp. A043]|uniref:ABC transporter ATP-binding protein n=1 Tax=Carboxylicivirga litoralis TaxID=2816963 RepID=UPI0021CAE7C7|nr:ABC transporter ATP-binding protein [Carboxylicivirga sp. A043]MCU4155829.1 ABC transporter ATP-binding protein [Carboxylicivirga sp. A043]